MDLLTTELEQIWTLLPKVIDLLIRQPELAYKESPIRFHHLTPEIQINVCKTQ